MAAVRSEAALAAFEAGKTAFKASNWEEAKKKFTEAVEACPSFLEAYGWRAKVDVKLGFTTEALNDYTRLINTHKKVVQDEVPDF